MIPDLAATLARDRRARGLRPSTRARSRRRSPPRRGSTRTTSRSTGPSGSSRCATTTAGSRSASCRRTGRARRRSSRSRSTTDSTPRPALTGRGDEARARGRARARRRRAVPAGAARADAPRPAARPRQPATARSTRSRRALPRGGTTYLCAVDADGTAISLIQSVYGSFGSGVVAGGTGVVLQNRAAGFVEEDGHPNRLAPARTSVPHDHPGDAARGRRAARAVRRDGRADAAAGPPPGRAPPRRPRRRSAGCARRAALARRRRPPRAARARALACRPELERLGHDVARGTVVHDFGVGQAILRLGDALVGGSDGRGDGYAAGV